MSCSLGSVWGIWRPSPAAHLLYASPVTDPVLVPMDADDTRAVQVDILCYIDDFCARANLRYFLWAGTLLGSVRHGGFIPWDDDIDLAMPRPDYEEFIRRFAVTDTGYYRLFSRDTHETYGYPFARVADDRTQIAERARLAVRMGVSVDVFPIDGWPRGSAQTRLHRIRMDLLHRAVSVWRSRPREGARRRLKNLAIRAARPFLDRVPVRLLTGAITSAARSIDYSRSQHVGVTAFRYVERVPRDAYGTPRDIEFEGRTFRAGPQESAVILTRLYGDYMTPPPASARTHRHFHSAYRLVQPPSIT